jgi:hypothetical protein
MGAFSEINIDAYKLLEAIADLNALETRLNVGLHTTQGIKMSYSCGACVDALNEATICLSDSYAQAIELIQRSRQYLINAISQFEAADTASARSLFILQRRQGGIFGARNRIRR